MCIYSLFIYLYIYIYIYILCMFCMCSTINVKTICNTYRLVIKKIIEELFTKKMCFRYRINDFFFNYLIID